MKKRGYSLIEVVIAGALLAIGVAGAAMLAHIAVQTEEAGIRATRALNTQEQAGRLFQLGLSPTAITNLIPERCTTNTSPPLGSINISFATNATNISGLAMEFATCTIRFPTTMTKDGNTPVRTNAVLLVRPTIR